MVSFLISPSLFIIGIFSGLILAQHSLQTEGDQNKRQNSRLPQKKLDKTCLNNENNDSAFVNYVDTEKQKAFAQVLK